MSDTETEHASPIAIKRRAIELLRSMRELAISAKEAQSELCEVETNTASVLREVGASDSQGLRERQNQMSYLRAELEMNLEMHARLEGVFQRLIGTLEPKESKVLMGMYQASARL